MYPRLVNSGSSPIKMQAADSLCQGRRSPVIHKLHHWQDTRATQTFRAQDMQRQASILQEAAMIEPVIITYHDRPRLVLMSMQEYDRLRGRGTAGETELPENDADRIETLAHVGDTSSESDAFEPAHGAHP
jgi:PHD/YefM family antitoxin component YafN of YafNO toxin-antitoxin module